MSRRPHVSGKSDAQSPRLTRREALVALSSALVAGPLWTAGCSSDAATELGGGAGGPTTAAGGTTATGAGVPGAGAGADRTTGETPADTPPIGPGTTGGAEGGVTTGDGSAPAGGANADAGSIADAGGAADASVTQVDASPGMDDAATTPPVTGWASGGTAAMTGIASYPNPFDGVAPTACALTGSMTLGPCYDPASPLREDISEGQAGLPMRFGLRVLDADCQPVTDASVDIWQVHALGLYSGNPSPGGNFCTSGDAEAEAALWFRGHQPTDENGVAWFKSCFPGWYSGRALHTHFTLRRPGPEGIEYLTAQVAFPDDLTREICGSHVDYAARGQPDTSNASDGVFPADVSPFIVETERMSDGALLAWKTLIIRS